MTTDHATWNDTIITLPIAEVIDGNTLRFERLLAVPPARAWELLTTPEGWGWCAGMEADLRVGGAFVLRFDETDSMEGTITELETGARIVMRWLEVERTADAPPVFKHDSILRVELTPTADGTRLVLTHQHLTADSAPGHGAGWHGILGHLQAVSAGERVDWMPAYKALIPRYQALIAETFAS